MDPGVKALWVALLRSGSYAQGTQFLHNPYNNTYCCLGVLCEAAEAFAGIRTNNMIRRFPPQAILDWSGLAQLDALTLANMNDGVAEYLGSPQSFNQIADYIDANL